jgi:hypothetical protein
MKPMHNGRGVLKNGNRPGGELPEAFADPQFDGDLLSLHSTNRTRFCGLLGFPM